MPSLEVLAAFTVASLLMNLSPGPSNLYVASRSIAQGPSAGYVAAAGLAFGSLVHVVAATLGIAALFAYSPYAYTVLKLLGACYLIYLGVKYWRSSEVSADVATLGKNNYGQIFRQSVWVEVTNPKTALFFVAFLPQFTDPGAGALMPQFLLLGSIVTLTAIPCDIAVSYGSHRAATWVIDHPNAQLIQNRLSGTILLGLSAFIIAER